MSDKAGKDSAYRKEYQDFITKLQKFHESRRTTFIKIPSFGGKDLDLLLLYKTVTSLGGFCKVTDEKKWPEVVKCLNLPLKCTNGAFALRQHYIRFLEHYERINFFGEDSEDAVTDGTRQSLSLTGARPSLPGQTSATVGMIEPVKPPLFGPLGELRTYNFNKLILSLSSGLPNEVDFALNICTLLSNVTNSIFNLAKAPGIVDLMLLHAGIWTTETVNAEDMYKEWYQESERDFVKFWREALDDKCAKELFENGLSGADLVTSLDSNNDVDDVKELFANCAVDTNDPESNRVLQICVILHNFSFEDLNAMFLATHKGAKRFLMLCAGTRQSTLRRVALDTLDNLADRLSLLRLEDCENQKYLQMLHNFLDSRDRIRRVRAMTIMAKLASSEENEELLSEGIALEAYGSLIRSLTIPDIQMILAALDALYFLSHLGEVTATSIVMIYGAVDILVCLVTVHAESYGNRAIAGFRIVENKNSVYSQKNTGHQLLQRPAKHPHIRMGQPSVSHPQVPQVMPPQPYMRATTPSARPPNIVSESMPQLPPESEETEEIDPEIFTAQWISAYYELSPSNTVSRSDMYSDYLETCNRLGRLGILPASNFNKILRVVIPEQHLQGTQTNMDGHYNISGVKRRANPLPVQSRVPRQRASIPVVGIHGNAPRPNVAPTGFVQGQRAQMPSLPVQRSARFLVRQQTGMAHPNFQPPHVRPEFNVRPDFQGSQAQMMGVTPDSQGDGTNPVSFVGSSSQEASSHVSGVYSSKSGPLKETGVKTLFPPNASVGGPLNSEGAPNVCISSSSVGTALPSNNGSPPVVQPTLPNQQDGGSNQYQTAMEQIKREMQQHFMQFHFHRQQIQNIQTQLQQAVQQSQVQQLPQNVMEEIETRVRSHHSQMQLHYQKLQQLQVLMQQVQQKAAHEQQASKDSIKDNIPASPKSKKTRKGVPQTPKGTASQNATLKDTPTQQGFPHHAGLPGSPRVMNLAGWPPSIATSLNNAQQQPAFSNCIGDSNVQRSVSTGGQTLTSGGHVVAGTGTQNGPQVPPLSVHSANQTYNEGITTNRPTSVLATSQSGISSSVSSTDSESVSQSVSNAPNGPAPLVAELNVAALGKSNVLPTIASSMASVPSHFIPQANIQASTVQVINPNAHPPRFMIVQGAPNMIPPGGAPAGFPQNAMVMIPPVAATAFPQIVSGLPLIRNQIPVSENRQQPILPKEQPNNPVASQMVRPSIQFARLPVSAQSSSSSQPFIVLNSTVSSSIRTSLNASADHAVQPPVRYPPMVCQSELIGSSPSSTSSSGILQQHSSVTSAIPVHQQNGSLHNASKQEHSQLVNVSRETGGNTRKTPHAETLVTSVPRVTLQTVAMSNWESKPAASNTPNAPAVSSSSTDARVSLNSDMSKRAPNIQRQHEKSFCDDISDKDTPEREKKRLKLVEDVHKLDKQERTVNAINGMLDNRFIQMHEKGDLWLNGLHSPTSVKVKENCVDKLAEQRNEEESMEQEKLTKTDLGVTGGTTDWKAANGGITRTCSEKSNFDNIYTGVDVCNSEETKSIELVSTTVSGEQKMTTMSNAQSCRTSCSYDISSETNVTKPEEVTTGDANRHDIKNESRCLWEGCNSSFSSSNNLLSHMVCSHAPREGQFSICRVSGCSSVQRPRGSMICHFQQKHCSNMTEGDTLPQVTLPELLFPKVADLEKKEDESPVTRSVRLTSALILRNIARNSSYGRQLIRKFEERLVLTAMSNSEASGAVSSCLAELAKRRTTSHLSASEEDS